MHCQRVLFIGHTNSVRSQIAEALLRHYGEGRYDVYSAGLEPGDVASEAIDVLHEQGIRPSMPTSKCLRELPPLPFDYVITVCETDHEAIEVAGKPERMRWRFDDPSRTSGDRMTTLRRIRDEILNRVRFFILTDRPDA